MESTANPNPQSTKKNNRKKKPKDTEGNFRFALDTCSKHKDLQGAISLYESATSQNNNIRLTSHHFNVLLYLCSNSVFDPSTKSSAIDYGFRIFNHMVSCNITPNEATITALARLASAKGDGDYAFDLVKDMEKYGATPKLRTHDPALFCFCGKLQAEKAYQVDEHMMNLGISVEEPEISALLKVSADTGREDRVYEYLHKLRETVRCVSVSTAEVIEDWFRSETALEVGSLDWNEHQIKEVVLRNGGGWHGQGWIGKGKWDVCRTNVDANGKCCCCGEKLVCVDIDRVETEKFAQSVASLALNREAKANFRGFVDWLEKHASYEAIVDGANIGLYQQNFADGGFNISQLDAVVRELYNRSQEKWPLVILHNKRVQALSENPLSRKLLEDWKSQGVLYTTPNGSNDDWYWLYAAVKLKCWLVTNDEMRDHIFELVGRSFILKWKERHQVRYTFVKGKLELRMPPIYSSVIQESEKGTWHVPLAGEGEDGSTESWLCINRSNINGSLDKVVIKMLDSEVGRPTLNSCKLTSGNALYDIPNSSPIIYDRTTKVTGKRKDRSPSPLL